MDRRKFLLNSSLSLCAVGLSGSSFSRMFRTPLFTNENSMAEDRVLVMLRLGGGNDGLNTVIPLDQYANLMIQRPDIIIPELDLLNLTGTSLGLHPKMTGMRNLFDDGEMAVVQGVAAPTGRSHFRASEVWMTGISDANHVESETGWLGRILDQEYPGFPSNYPNSAYEDPFAITFNTTPSATCEGHQANFAHPVIDPNNTANIYGGSTTGVLNSYNGSHIEYLEFLGNQTNQYNERIQESVGLGNSISQNYGTDDVSVALQNIAKMISGGLKSMIYVVDIGGFDTHSNQIDPQDINAGVHGGLWEKISNAVSAFQEDMHALGLNERVIGMTFSEFGRQIAQNGSNGTDHGEAACMFLFGSCIKNQVIGTNPVISDVVVNGDALPLEIDYRDIYSTLLRDWFGIPEIDIEQNFEDYGGITYYHNLIDPCSVIGMQEQEKSQLNVNVYPNPTTGDLFVDLYVPSGNKIFTMVDIKGKLVGQFERNVPTTGVHKLMLPTSKLSAGAYFLRIQGEETDRKIKFVVQ